MFMQLSLDQARLAGARGEVPIGAIVVRQGVVLGSAGNRPVGTVDPTAHAEIAALRAAASKTGNYRIVGADLFVTVEPCLMCVGAILQARLARVVFGCRDAKGGFVGSLGDFSADARLNHSFSVRSGVRADEARQLLREFFRARRAG